MRRARPGAASEIRTFRSSPEQEECGDNHEPRWHGNGRSCRRSLVFGRNMWQRPFDEALAMTEQIKDLLRQFPA